jgi:hypothetical protein
MIWIPLLTMLTALALREAFRLAGTRGQAPIERPLPFVFAGAAVWLLVEIFLHLDLKTLARETQTGLLAVDAAHGGLVTALMTAAGLWLFAFGGGRAAGRVIEADPEGPIVSVTGPVLAALAGLVLLLLAYFRIAA